MRNVREAGLTRGMETSFARRAWIILLSLATALVLTGCAPAGPRAVAAGDQCDYCRMEIADERFASQVVTRTGKTHLFDSVECLAGYLAGAEPGTVRSTWMKDAETEGGGEWVSAESAGYLVDASLRAPMGRVISFATPAAAAAAQVRLGGITASWQAVRSDSGGIVSHAGH
ncbi:MAG: nitrous oxide reductase accessory protein NosL [Gemmatimonadaceae bacterium]